MEASAYVLIYFGVMSFVGFALTVYDKLAAQANKRRIPENTLMILGFLGAAAGMYITMQLIRHKTNHKKFMTALPVFALVHIAIIACVIIFA